jgi:hypothetical protein
LKVESGIYFVTFRLADTLPREVLKGYRACLSPREKPFDYGSPYDHLVRDEADFVRVWDYTIQNPVKAGLYNRPGDWPYIIMC